MRGSPEVVLTYLHPKISENQPAARLDGLYQPAFPPLFYIIFNLLRSLQASSWDI
jgi:hypothetical protein